LIGHPIGQHMTEKLLWAPRAWINGGWQNAVVLRVNSAGQWGEITPGIFTPPAQATVLAGPVIPGLVNAHSHAFQRAFAGLAERRDTDSDDFWSWRERMYGVASRITPQQLRAVAAQLYVELLRGGYTQACEFHYLHHAPDGRAYDDPATMSWALADGAADVGIGLTVLPALYERAGFAVPALRGDQRRFRSTPALVHQLHQTIRHAQRPLLNAGVAIHSLRAASGDSIADLMERIADDAVPIHIHAAEQTREVEECVTATGARPIEWLCRKLRPDARWQLVHATHAMPSEIDAVAASGAGIVICPSTEANLGDGLPDVPRWLSSGAPISLGSDSQVSRCWVEELRWLEYAQRISRRERNVAAAPAAGQPSTAARLFDTVVSGGGRAAGFAEWGLKVGARADALVLDARAPGLLGTPSSHTIDALVFATDAPIFREVHVAGNFVMVDGRHACEADIAQRFSDVMSTLWGE
jgi:formimidoylglutamate deiminase